MAAVQSSVSIRMATERNKNHDDDASSSKKRLKTCGNGGVGPWSDPNHHVLYLVMMLLGVVDYLSFRRVCKSWRSLALSNWNIFMASKPPMTTYITLGTVTKSCCFVDFEGRKFRTTLHSFSGGIFVGISCGYVIFFRRETRDFWLVNPITRHQLCFTNFPFKYKNRPQDIRAILVFSRSVCGWVFVVMHKLYSTKIWLSIAGKGAWNHVSCSPSSSFTDLRAFKGAIFALNFNSRTQINELYELRLINQEPKPKLLKTKNSLKPSEFSELVSSGENIYVMDRTPEDRYRFQELDFDEMKWILREKKVGESASFLGNFKHGVAYKQHFRGIRGQCLLQGHNTGEMLKLTELEKTSSYLAKMWYFPRECLNVDRLDDY